MDGHTEPQEFPSVRIVHDRVRGRLRLNVAGLRANAALKASLETGLPRHSVVHSARASAETGNVLIRYPPAEDVHVIIAVVAQCLAGPDAKNTVDDVGSSKNASSAGCARDPRPSNGDETPDETTWFTWPHGKVLTYFGVDAQHGLSAEQAAKIGQREGPNVLQTARARRELEILLDQVASLPTGLLAGSALLSVVTGGLIDAVATVAVIAINSAIGFVTERDAERTISSLDRTGARHANVLRNGHRRRVDIATIVPGDILQLNPGTVIAADGRILEADALSIDESLLTGESLPALKSAGTIKNPRTPIGERTNMIFRGTSVTGGAGSAVVVGTGANTEIGRIQALTGSSRPPETPMQKQLDRLGRQFVIGSLGVCGLMFAVGMLRGYGRLEMLKSATSLAVAALPEGLPTVATVTLALGIRQMRQRRAIVRRLDAVETLGSVNVVCFDKTGTLTQNRMTASQIIVDADEITHTATGLVTKESPLDLAQAPALAELMNVAVLCSEATAKQDQDGGWQVGGSATESALLDLALANGIEPSALRQRMPIVDLQPRSDGRNYMISRHVVDNTTEYYAIKGSPEEVLSLSSEYCGLDGAVNSLDDAARARMLDQNSRLAGKGLRVLGFAAGYRTAGTATPRLRWLGIVGLSDPVRPEAVDLMKVFHRAGVRTVMITGDQTSTAYAIAADLDLSNGEPVEILEGSQADLDNGELLSALADKCHVFARVSPANKLRIVRALQDSGNVVAMTGDGINDSPSLRAAEIGIAMGSGTDAAHEVSDLVLQDDQLATLAEALQDGRGIYHNIRNSIHYLLATNMSEIAVMFAATGLGLGRPLSPLQLLTINIATDIFPALALAVEPAPAGIMAEPPRDPERPMFDRSDLWSMAQESAVITTSALGAYLYGRRRFGTGGGTTGLVFTTLSLAQLLHAITCRNRQSGNEGRIGGGRLSGRLALASFGPMALQLAAAAFPVSRRLLGLTGSRPIDFLVAGALAGGSFAVNEVFATLKRHDARLHAAASLPRKDGSDD